MALTPTYMLTLETYQQIRITYFDSTAPKVKTKKHLNTSKNEWMINVCKSAAPDISYLTICQIKVKFLVVLRTSCATIINYKVILHIHKKYYRFCVSMVEQSLSACISDPSTNSQSK